MTLDARMEATEQRIQQACDRAGRRREEVRVVAVTKSASVQRVAQLIDAGYDQLGENRWQVLEPKVQAFHHVAISWHFIGHVQKNKVQPIVATCSVVHSIDRFSIAQKIDQVAQGMQKRIDGFVQVNVAREPQKHGITSEELPQLLSQLRTLSFLRITGLMTIAPLTEDADTITSVFRTLRQLRDEVNERGVYGTPLEHLSMGMSQDLEYAIAEGATWLRIGGALV